MVPPGPPRRFDREIALQIALRLFWQHGYAGVSLDELLKQMGIGRQSFYNAFGSKAALFHEAVSLYIQQCQLPALGLLEEPGSPRANILRFLRAWESTTEHHRGCLLVNICCESPPDQPETWEIVTAAMRRFEHRLAKTLERSMQQGEIQSACSAARLAEILTTLGNGMMVQSRSSHEHADAAGLLTETFEQLAPPRLRAEQGPPKGKA